jgi:hypothetical protein
VAKTAMAASGAMATAKKRTNSTIPSYCPLVFTG